MKLSIGIVGLPNVGKSTLFNALTKNDIAAENYPFCTIDPNVGIVPVADPRLEKITELIKPEKKTPAVVEFWDIAGLVKGAATGEGLGNKFLANIREVNAIAHVVRDFQNDNITHVEDSIDPKRDVELIHTELILKDLETVSKKIASFGGEVRANPKLRPVASMYENLENHLSDGNLANTFDYDRVDEEVTKAFRELFLLTAKPFIFILNVDESRAEAAKAEFQQVVGEPAVILAMDIKLEAEIASLDDEEQAEYIEELGMDEPAIDKLSRVAYETLGLQSFFTAGETEVRAWTIPVGATAPQAAGTIHTDFEKKFIVADVVHYQDFVDNNGWLGSKTAGKVILGGKDYVVQDGDVMLIKHNA